MQQYYVDVIRLWLDAGHYVALLALWSLIHSQAFSPRYCIFTLTFIDRWSFSQIISLTQIYSQIILTRRWAHLFTNNIYSQISTCANNEVTGRWAHSIAVNRSRSQIWMDSLRVHNSSSMKMPVCLSVRMSVTESRSLQNVAWPCTHMHVHACACVSA